ncbi:hypothetical protein DY000_02040914 [Brassica cretica]|uniref:Uncharacterized protein n=1 Tax=Brassica cretica TaxID=69181 RepID=A0ABQ7BL38_BRACR|nr:hypothetical protein DY000_02040914 [Brassica cretica]
MHGLMSYRRFGRTRSLRSDRAERTLGRYVATKLRLELGRYVATERKERSVATTLGRYVATELRLELGRYVAIERDGCSVATDAPQSMDQNIGPYQNGDQAVQNSSAEVRLPSRTVQNDRAVYRLDPLTSGMELRPSPGLEDGSDQASTRPSQPSRQAKANSRARLDLDRARLDLDNQARLDLDRAKLDLDSQARLDFDRARLDLDREVSQNDRDFSLLVRLARTECSKDRADGLTLMSDSLLDFYHSDFSKAQIIQLSEDLGHISTLLDQATDCPARPTFVQLLTAATSTWTNESRHQPKSHIDQI